MKTIAFTSYKGGVGRTYLMANIGVMLARLGKKVALLDFDFDAPGILYKFELSPFVDAKAGFVDYVSHFLENDEDTKLNIGQLFIKPKLGKAFSNAKKNGRKGEIALLPTGNLSKPEYWEILSDTKWINLFHPSEPISWKVKFFNEKLRGGIENEGFDYLLIDGRAGANLYRDAILNYVADSVVVCFGNNLENVEGSYKVMQGLVRRIEWREKHKDRFELGRIQVFPVLNRFSPFFVDLEENYRKLNNKRKHVLLTEQIGKFWANKFIEIIKENRFNEVYSLPSFLELDNKEHLMLDLDGSVQDVGLTRYLVGLLGEFCPELLERDLAKKKRDSREPIEILWEQMALPGDIDKPEKDYKVFLQMREGLTRVLLNLADRERNVSFKAETFFEILTSLYKELVANAPRDKSCKDVENEANKSFDNAGYFSGQHFGEALVNKVWKKKSPKTYIEKIERWCEFDSDVGFGELSSEFHGKDCTSGSIGVMDNFLALEIDRNAPNLCKIMEGYIRGVLEVILEKKITGKKRIEIKHEPKNCIRCRKKIKTCKFEFKLVNG